MVIGLIKATHYYSKLEAIKDWNKLVERAKAMGREDLVEKFQYKEKAGHRTIDKQAAKLREALLCQGCYKEPCECLSDDHPCDPE